MSQHLCCQEVLMTTRLTWPSNPWLTMWSQTQFRSSSTKTLPLVRSRQNLGLSQLWTLSSKYSAEISSMFITTHAGFTPLERRRFSLKVQKLRTLIPISSLVRSPKLPHLCLAIISCSNWVSLTHWPALHVSATSKSYQKLKSNQSHPERFMKILTLIWQLKALGVVLINLLWFGLSMKKVRK